MPKATKILVALVFAAIFGGIGAGASWIIGRTIYDAKRAESWVKVQASVDSWKSGSVSYRYTFDGTEYKGDRTGAFILGGRDKLDDWYSDMNYKLSRARDRHEPITVYVNPQDPRESMVDHTLRWKLLAIVFPFAIGFGGVGLAALWMLLTTLFAREQDPATWTPGSAAPRRSSGLGGQWGMAIMWNAIAFPIAFIAVPPIWENGEWVGLIVVIFPLIGVLLLWGALSSTVSAAMGALRSSRREGVDMNALAQAAKQDPKAPSPWQDAAGGTVFARGMISEGGSASSPDLTRADASSQASAAAMALDPDAPPPAVASTPATDAELERFEQVLKQGKLDANARAQLAKLPPGARKLVMAVLVGGSWLPRIFFAIIALVILSQIWPAIVALIRSTQ